MVKNSSKFKRLKNNESKISIQCLDIGAMGKPMFLFFGTRKKFNQLQQAYIETLMFRYFDPETHIQIQTNASDYAIEGLFSQLNTDQVDPNRLKNLTKFDFS